MKSFFYVCLIIIITVFFIFNNNIENFENKRVIPLNIFTTWHTRKLPPDMKKAFELTCKKNPEFNIQFFDVNDCREFIRNNFDNKVLKAFECIKPQAYKSDLWRYCVLYKKGGIYYDIKFVPTNNFKFIELTDKEYFVRDLPQSGSGVVNGFMVAKKNNPNLLKAINQIVKNINEKYYGNSTLEITGPLLLKNILNNNEVEKSNLELINENGIVFVTMNDRKILKSYPTYRKEQSLFGQGDHYEKAWLSKNVYC